MSLPESIVGSVFTETLREVYSRPVQACIAIALLTLIGSVLHAIIIRHVHLGQYSGPLWQHIHGYGYAKQLRQGIRRKYL